MFTCTESPLPSLLAIRANPALKICTDGFSVLPGVVMRMVVLPGASTAKRNRSVSVAGTITPEFCPTPVEFDSVITSRGSTIEPNSPASGWSSTGMVSTDTV